MSIVSGIWGAEASKSAAETQADAAKDAAQVQWLMYNQTRADQAPLREAGAGAINALWGTGGTSAQTIPGAPIYSQAGTQPVAGSSSWQWVQNYNWETGQMEPQYVLVDIPASQMPTQQQIIGYQPSTTIPGTPGTQGLIQKGPGEFKESEGYKWTLGQGLQAQQRQASATGRLGSGDYIKDATKYAEGLASTEYDNFLERYYKSLDPYFRLAGYGSNVAMTGGNQAIQAGNALANTYQQGGQAQAAGIMGGAQSGVNALRTATNFGMDYYKNYGSPWASTAPSWGSLGGWGNTIAGSAEGANAMYWL